MKVLKCAEYKPDCTTPNLSVPANPDIAGIGVLISFLATACFAFLIAFSVMFLEHYETLVTWFRKYFLRRNEPYEEDPDGPYWRSAHFWFQVLSKNLLAFSDTHLLTGLAIQFTAILQHCTISIYHFQVVVELAFLTTVTHMLALVALRNYFVKNKWINLPRIFFMLANLGLLGYTSYIAYSYDLAGLHSSSSLACFFQGDRPRFRAAFGGRYATLLIGAIGGHVTVILAMYFFNEKKQVLLKLIGALLRAWLIAPVYAVYGLVMGGKALRNTQALGVASVQISGSEKEWGFGQFLPVLLLALPLFAGWESFWEEKDEDRENRFGRRGKGSQSGSRSMLNMTSPSAFEMRKQPPHTHHTRLANRSHSDDESRIESYRSSPAPSSRLGSSPQTQQSPSQYGVGSPHIPPPPPQIGLGMAMGTGSPSPTQSPSLGMPSPHLSVPLRTGSSPRPRTPSRFEEHMG